MTPPTATRYSRQRQAPGSPAAFAPPPVLALILASTLSACAALPPPTGALPAVEVPAAWSVAATANAAAAPSRATSLAQWWQRFDDPVLDQLESRALQTNTDIQSARAALQQARALRDVSAAALLPGVDGSASAQRGKSGSASSSNTFSVGFDASWEPDVFGANRSDVDAAEADARASSASLADIQVSLAAEVAVAYIELRGAQARLAIARENLTSQLETLQITDWRMQAGLVTSLETEQARAASEQTRAQIPALETSIAQLQHSLAVLTGQAPAALLSVLDEVRPVPRAADDLALSIPAETLRQRPDVRAAEQRVSAALARVAQADAARYPSFQISGSLGLRAATLGGLGGGGAVVNALLGGISLPIFDGGAAKARVRGQEAALEQARSAYQAAVLSALRDVEDTLAALRGNRERLARLRAAAEAAGNAALLARQNYASGLVDFQTVLETQRTLLNTQDAVAATQTDLSADHVRLYKALGGGWSNDIPLDNESAPAPVAPRAQAVTHNTTGSQT